MQTFLGTARSQADMPTAGKQNGLLGKLACKPDGSASRIFFLRSLKIAGCNVSHKTKALKIEEINSQTFLETAMLPGFTLLMLYNAFFPG